MIKLYDHRVNPFGFRKGKTGKFYYQLRANFFLKTFYSKLGTEKEEDFLLLWNLVGGRVGYQASQEFCYV